MNAKLFKEVCVLMWGPYWQAEAARELGIGRSSVVRYGRGDRPVPAETAGDLLALLVGRHEQIERLMERMAKAARPTRPVKAPTRP